MKFLKGIGIIVGLMFGAGIFALPFVIAKAGILWGAVHLAIALAIMLSLLFFYAEVAYFTEGTHRFAGYVERVLGKKWKLASFAITAVSYYGTLLAYGVLAGLFLSNILPFGFFELSMAFFAVSAFFILLKLGKIALANFYLSIPLFGFIAYFVYTAFPFVKMSNFIDNLGSLSFSGGWFLPYGVWLFALSAIAVVPDAKDIFKNSPLKDFKKVILWSVILSAVFYCLFVFAILGVSGQGATEDALSGVSGVLGAGVIWAGSLMGFLAVFTSFLSLGADLREMLRFDFDMPKITAWLSVAAPPVALFLLGLQDFTKILGLVGSLGVGVMGTLIVLMVRKKRGKNFWQIVVMAAILLAVIYQVWMLF